MKRKPEFCEVESTCSATLFTMEALTLISLKQSINCYTVVDTIITTSNLQIHLLHQKYVTQ